MPPKKRANPSITETHDNGRMKSTQTSSATSSQFTRGTRQKTETKHHVVTPPVQKKSTGRQVVSARSACVGKMKQRIIELSDDEVSHYCCYRMRFSTTEVIAVDTCSAGMLYEYFSRSGLFHVLTEFWFSQILRKFFFDVTGGTVLYRR